MRRLFPVATKRQLFWLLGLVSASFIYMLMLSVQKLRTVPVPIYPSSEVEKVILCGQNNFSRKSPPKDLNWIKNSTIYFITPTYSRREQIAELTRLGQTLQLTAQHIHWVIGEDSDTCSPHVSSLLLKLQIPFTHLASPQPLMYKEANLRFYPRGVSSRRAGLQWVLEGKRWEVWQPRQSGQSTETGVIASTGITTSTSSVTMASTVLTPSEPYSADDESSVVYFADDDNTYDIRLFDEIVQTKRVSMFPVGFIGASGISSPIVRNGKVIGFSDDWFAKRKWPVDMAGFAINLAFLRNKNPKAYLKMPYKAGYEEDYFLQNLHLKLDEIEPMADNCTQVLVWHTKTIKENRVRLEHPHLQDTNLLNLFKFVTSNGMAEAEDDDDLSNGHDSDAKSQSWRAAAADHLHPMKVCLGGKKCRTA